MQNTFRINVDLKKKTYIEKPVVTQNDAITFLISVFDNGSPFSLSEVTTATLAHTRLDGVTVVTEGTKVNDNTIKFVLGTEETKVPGRVSATVQLYDEDERVSTIRFTYTVLKDPTGNGYIPSEREQTLIETVLGEGPLVIQQAQDAANFANEQGQFAQEQANAANEAAQNANDAAQSATNAANEANKAAQSANTAAQSANDAATTANEAAQNANQAATSANEAAVNAATQAQYAQQQGDYAKAQGDYAKQVGDENKTRWLTAVNTYADIATTYPNPQLGDTVQTIDDSKIYRWDGTQWVWTQQYNANAITDVQNKIGILSNELSKQNKQSTVIGHGLNIINASQNSPLDVQIEGRTLVNLLGTQGRTATSATVTLDSAKYYVLVNEDGTNVTVDGVSQTVPYKFTGKSSVSLSWTSGKVALYEVDATEYSNILTTWTASEVNRRYPYVDSVQHVQNPYVVCEGENLLPPFNEWTLHANAIVKSPYELELNATVANQTTDITIPCLPNQQYYFKGNGSEKYYIAVLDANKAWIADMFIDKTEQSFTTPSNAKYLKVTTRNSTSGTFTFTNPILNLGSTAKPFVPRNPSTLFAEVKIGQIADKKDILWKDGQDWKILKQIEKDKVLDGSLGWNFVSDFTGYKRVLVTLENNALNGGKQILAKFDGKIAEQYLNNPTKADQFNFFGVNDPFAGQLYISISDTDSGWGETYTPTQAEIQAFFWGWRMCNGTYGQPYDGTGTKTWYPIGDTDLSRAVTTCPTSPAPTISEGKISYYKLSYVLATPKTEVVTDKVEGDLVVNGATQVEVGSGFTYTEVDGKRTYTKLAENARYSVTANILSVIANYDTSLKSVVDSLIAKQSDIASTVSVNVRAIAELYKRVKALGG